MRFLVLSLLLLTTTFVVETKYITARHDLPLIDVQNKTGVNEPQWQTITQRVNHFNPTDLRTWQMRYLSNDEYFQSGGPIFIFLGGEWEISKDTLMGGPICDMAQAHNGYMFYTEHRYYGQSYPTANMSTENLLYLSVDQALADIVYFVNNVKENIDGLQNSKVVVAGCSYSAAMATWIRLKYPHIIDVAYASSGPVKAVADFYENIEIISKNIGRVSQQCLQTISDGLSQLEAKLTTKGGIEEMSDRLHTCEKIQNIEPHRSYLFSIILDKFGYMVQGAGPLSIQGTCEQINSYPGSALDKLVEFIMGYDYDTLNTWNSDRNCSRSYDDYIKFLRATENSNIMWRPWIYQTCTEFGFYQTTVSKNYTFGNISLEYFVNLCSDIFGANFGSEILDNGIKRTNILYGASKPDITKLISVHGTGDPWHVLGILEDLNELAPSMVINATSHCADMGFTWDNHSQEIIAAKKRVKKLIADWIQ